MSNAQTRLLFYQNWGRVLRDIYEISSHTCNRSFRYIHYMRVLPGEKVYEIKEGGFKNELVFNIGSFYWVYLANGG